MPIPHGPDRSVAEAVLAVRFGRTVVLEEVLDHDRRRGLADLRARIELVRRDSEAKARSAPAPSAANDWTDRGVVAHAARFAVHVERSAEEHEGPRH